MNVLKLLLILCAIYILWYLIKLYIWIIRATKMTNNIPGPKPWPIIGNASLFAGIKTQGDMYKIIHSLFYDYASPADKIMKIWLGPKLLVFLGHPNHIETILSSQYSLEKDPIYNYIGITGNGLFVQNGTKWDELRKPLNKFLNKKFIESYLTMFHEKTLKFCQILGKNVDNGQSFNLRPYLTNYSLDTLCVSTLGYDLNEMDKGERNVSHFLERVVDITIKLIVQSPYNLSVLVAKLSNKGKSLKRLSEFFWNLSEEILKGRLEMKKKFADKSEDNPCYYSDVLLEKAARDHLSWQETGRLATDFLIAGFDTSAVMMSSTFLMLAMHPEYQEAVYQEQLEIVGDDPEVIPTWEQLSRMTYLSRILKEVMRLYCPPAIFRRLTNDIDLGGYKLPSGSTAYVFFYNLHRNPKFWSHPEEFYPDHFSPEEIASRPKGSYLPFSWGPRSCPGGLYAMTSGKILISSAIRKYRFETDLKYEDLTYKYSLLLEIDQGYMMKIMSRS